MELSTNIPTVYATTDFEELDPVAPLIIVEERAIEMLTTITADVFDNVFIVTSSPSVVRALPQTNFSIKLVYIPVDENGEYGLTDTGDEVDVTITGIAYDVTKGHKCITFYHPADVLAFIQSGSRLTESNYQEVMGSIVEDSNQRSYALNVWGVSYMQYYHEYFRDWTFIRVDKLWPEYVDVNYTLWNVTNSPISIVTNRVVAESVPLSQKHRLHLLLSDRDYIPETMNLDVVTNVTYPLILRPSGEDACSGKGISVVRTRRELLAYKRKLNRQWDYIATRYIDNPLLYPITIGNDTINVKWHFRVMLLVNSLGQYQLLDRTLVFTANREYDPNSSDPCIYDTHMKGTPYHIEFPTHFEGYDIDALRRGVEMIASDVAEMTIKTVQSPLYSWYSYETMGLDIMFSDDYHPWLIEVNLGAGTSTKDSDPLLRSYRIDYEHLMIEFGVEPALEAYNQLHSNSVVVTFLLLLRQSEIEDISKIYPMYARELSNYYNRLLQYREKPPSKNVPYVWIITVDTNVVGLAIDSKNRCTIRWWNQSYDTQPLTDDVIALTRNDYYRILREFPTWR